MILFQLVTKSKSSKTLHFVRTRFILTKFLSYVGTLRAIKLETTPIKVPEKSNKVNYQSINNWYLPKMNVRNKR